MIKTNCYTEIKKIIEKIPPLQPIIISGHENADQDSICSSLALAYFLKKIGKKDITVLLSEKDLYKIEWFSDRTFINNTTNKKDYIFIMLDLNRKSRLGEFENVFSNAILTINIDHHEDNKNECNYIKTDVSASSTCEMLYYLFECFDCPIDKTIASLLYAGILTDTLCFSQRLSSKTFCVSSSLLKYNIDYNYITKKTFWERSLDEINALANLINNIQYNQFHYVVMNRNNPLYADLEYSLLFKKMTPILKNIDCVEVLAMFLIDDNIIYGEFKSNINIDVSKLAIKLGGGGHKHAAGFTSTLPFQEILSISQQYIYQQKKKLKILKFL